MNKKVNNKFIIGHIANYPYTDVSVLHTGYEETLPSKQSVIYNNSTHFSLHYVAEGKGFYQINGKNYEVNKNNIFCTFANNHVEFRQDEQQPWKYYWIMFTGNNALMLLRRINLSPQNPILYCENPNIVQCFKSMVIDSIKKEYASDLIALSNLYKIITLLSKSTSDKIRTTSFSNKVLEYINIHYNDPSLSLTTVANHLGFNASYLSRQIKKDTGIPFSNHLINIRLKAAVDLIDKGYYSVSAVAGMVGFSDQYYFSKVFKKYNLIPPHEHIKKVKAEKEKGKKEKFQHP